VRTKPDKVWDMRGKIVTLSKSLTGLPYRYGGDDIDGFDCSGLVRYVYGCFGFEVPRTAKKQGKLKNKVTLKKAKPGDIVVFKLKRKRWHSGIIIGKEYFIHAPNRREPVREEFFNSYWRSHLAAVIRIIDE
jgi:cell wall-associated NlpC family hydrolase